jgi:hypothetical protein
MIQSSRALAEAGHFPELIAGAQLSLGHWHRAQAQFTQAIPQYRSALNKARSIGSRRLECEVLSELSRLALDLGDAEVARQRAMESLRIANELVLGLKQTHGLILLGQATAKAGQQKLGISYIKHAKRLADRQGYLLRGQEAEEQLHALGASAEEP